MEDEWLGNNMQSFLKRRAGMGRAVEGRGWTLVRG